MGEPLWLVFVSITFTLYTTSLGAIARKHIKQYFDLDAEDMRWCMAFRPSNRDSLILIISNIHNCVFDMEFWIIASKLQLRIFSADEQKHKTYQFH